MLKHKHISSYTWRKILHRVIVSSSLAFAISPPISAAPRRDTDQRRVIGIVTEAVVNLLEVGAVDI